VGQLDAPVPFVVSGCSEFDLSLEDAAGTRRSLSFTRRTDGSFEASVPVAWMSAARVCSDSEGTTVAGFMTHGSLIVTCRDAARTATAEFWLRSRTAEFVSGGLYDGVRAIFPSDDPLQPAMILAGDVEGGGYLSFPPDLMLWSDWLPFASWSLAFAQEDSFLRPRLARRDARAFVTLGCGASSDCPTIAVTTGRTEKVPTERLAEIELPGEYLSAPIALAHVPSSVIDMAYAPDGSLVVLSQWAGRSFTWNRTLVTRVVPALEGSPGTVEDAMTVIGDFPREAVGTRFSRMDSGDLAFATLDYGDPTGDVSLNLHETDGATVTTHHVADGLGHVQANSSYADWLGWVFLSPDASRMVLSTGREGQASTWSMRTDRADGVQHPFSSPFPAAVERSESVAGGAVWLPGAVALWMGSEWGDPESLVQVFDDAPPHALRWVYRIEPLAGSTVAPYLMSATAAGGRLVLTTSTGLRILDLNGNLVGGSDPLPCGRTTTAPAEPTGPNTVAVGAGLEYFVFDVEAP
jgi:hypothetical protein